jgi:hypothetical protein
VAAAKLSKREKLRQQREALPSYAYKDQFIKAVFDHQVLIIVAETGAGKTTQLPQYLLEAGFGEAGVCPPSTNVSSLTSCAGVGCCRCNKVSCLRFAVAMRGMMRGGGDGSLAGCTGARVRSATLQSRRTTRGAPARRMRVPLRTLDMHLQPCCTFSGPSHVFTFRVFVTDFVYRTVCVQGRLCRAHRLGVQLRRVAAMSVAETRR